MGVTAGDPDEDGDEDLFITHLGGETNTYYRDGRPKESWGARVTRRCYGYGVNSDGLRWTKV